MSEGAYDFMEKPFTAQQLADMAGRAVDRRSGETRVASYPAPKRPTSLDAAS